MKTIQIFTKEVPSDEPAGHFSAFLKVGGALPYLVLDTDAVPQNLEVALTTVNLLSKHDEVPRELAQVKCISTKRPSCLYAVRQPARRILTGL